MKELSVYRLRLTLVVSCALLLSCAARSLLRVRELGDAIENGAFVTAVEEVREHEKLYGRLNRFLYRFDQGLLFHYAEMFDSSLRQLEAAEQTLDDLYARSVTNEAAAILTNDNIRPYRGRRYEQVLLHQFLGLNYLARREYDEALVESRKVQLVFDRFKDQDGARRGKYNDDGLSHFISALAYENQGEHDNAAISLYHSVKAYRNGPIEAPLPVETMAYRRLAAAGRDADIEELNLSPTSLPGPDPDSGESEIVLIGYAGKGPVLEETVFWGTYIVGGAIAGFYMDPNGDTISVLLPAPPLPPSELRREHNNEKTKAGTTFHLKFALPTVVHRESMTRSFAARVDSSSTVLRTAVLTDVGRLLEQDMKDNETRTLARTALRVVIRTIAAQRAKDEMTTKDPMVNLLLNFGTDLLADQLEKADTRLCFFLPNTVQIRRIPVPAGNHRLRVQALDRYGSEIESKVWENVRTEAGERTFVFYPCMR